MRTRKYTNRNNTPDSTLAQGDGLKLTKKSTVYGVEAEGEAETAILVGLTTKQQDERRTQEYLDELEFLSETAGAVTIKRFMQKMDGPNSATYVGSGR